MPVSGQAIGTKTPGKTLIKVSEHRRKNEGVGVSMTSDSKGMQAPFDLYLSVFGSTNAHFHQPDLL